MTENIVLYGNNDGSERGTATSHHVNHQAISRCCTRGESQDYTSCMPLPSVNKAAHFGFETHMRCQQKSKTGVLLPQQRDVSNKKFKKKE